MCCNKKKKQCSALFLLADDKIWHLSLGRVSCFEYSMHESSHASAVFLYFLLIWVGQLQTLFYKFI